MDNILEQNKRLLELIEHIRLNEQNKCMYCVYADADAEEYPCDKCKKLDKNNEAYKFKWMFEKIYNYAITKEGD